MNIESFGEGPDLVLVHGWAMNCDVFQALIDELGASFRIHLLDLPGHGRNVGSVLPLNAAAIAQDLADRIPAAHWLGWSLGGVIALEIAARKLLPVLSLSLISSSPSFVRRAHWPHAVSIEIFEQFGHELLVDYERTLQRFLALEVVGTATARADLRSLGEVVFARGKPALRVLEEGLQILETSDLRADLESLDCGLRWIAGSRDRLVPPAAMREASNLCQRSEFVEIRGAGHAPFLSHTAEVARLVRELALNTAPHAGLERSA